MHRKPQLAWRATALLGPAVGWLGLFAVVPFVVLVVISLQQFDLARASTLGRFAGLSNYRSLLFSDPAFANSLRVTAVFSLSGILIEVGIGALLAVLLHRFNERLRRALLGIIILPAAMAPVTVGLMWLFLLQPDYGLVSAMLRGAFGFAGGVLTQPSSALMVVRLVDVWEWTPFVTVVLLAAARSIPVSLTDAARIDGLGWFETVRTVYWPYMRPVVGVVVLLRLIDSIRVFDTVYILTGGGPGSATEVAGVLIQRLAIRETRLGAAAAATVVVYYIILVLTGLLYRAVRQPSGESA